MQALMLLRCCECGRKVIGVVHPGVEDHIFVHQVGKDEHGNVWVHDEDEHWERVVRRGGLVEICPQCREALQQKKEGQL